MALRILVVGAGAVGGYFGARLAEAGRDVTFLVRPKRAEAIRRDGLKIVSPRGNLTLQPKLVTGDRLSEHFDLILLSVKAYGLAAAIEDFAPAVGPETMILPVLNGMAHIDRLIERFDRERVIGGVCRIASEIDAQGTITQFTPMQQIAYGEFDGTPSPRISQVDAVMQGVGFDAALSANIVQDLWDKWVLLAGLGAVTCLLRGTIGDVVAAPHGKETVLAILGECVGAATACGHAPSEIFRQNATAAGTQAGSPLTSSMYRDLKAGAPVEADHILGDLIARAHDKGIDTPLLKAAYVNLRVYQDGRGKG